MNRFIINKIVTGLLFGCLVLSADVDSVWAGRESGRRPAIEDLLPQTTVALFQIADVTDLIEVVWAEGALNEIRNDDDIAPFLEVVTEEGHEIYAEFEEQVGLSIEELLAIPTGEIVLAVIAPRREQAEYLFVVEVGEDNEAANKALARLREVIDGSAEEELYDGIAADTFPFNGQTVYVIQEGGLVIACSNKDELIAFFRRWDGEEDQKQRPLSRNRKFASIMSKCGDKNLPSDAVRYFLDPVALWKCFGRSDPKAQALLASLRALRLDCLLAAGGNFVFSDKDYEVLSHNHLLLSNEQKGLLKMMAMRTDEYQVEPWVPHDAQWYMTTSWDVPEMYAELGTIIDGVWGEGHFEQMAHELDEDFDLDLRQEFLEQLTGRFSYARVAIDPTKLTKASYAASLEVKDPDKVDAVLEELLSALNPGAFRVKETYRDVEFWCVDVDDGASPTVGIIRDSLFVTDSIEALKRMIDTEAGDVESLESSSAFLELSDRMSKLAGAEMPCAVAFNQPRFQVEALVGLLESGTLTAKILEDTEQRNAGTNGNDLEPREDVHADASNESPFVDAMKRIAESDSIPGKEAFSQYLKPNGMFAVSVDTGYHVVWFQERSKD